MTHELLFGVEAFSSEQKADESKKSQLFQCVISSFLDLVTVRRSSSSC